MAKRSGKAAGGTADADGAKVQGKGAAKAKGPSIAVRRACYLEVLRRSANVSRAAREAGIATSTVYKYRAKNAAFAAEWDAAVAEALDELEDALIQRAKHGVEKPVYYGGSQVGTVRTYSDTLGMFLLKARRPEQYARLQTIADDAATMGEAEARAEVDRRLDRLARAAIDVRDAADGPAPGDAA